jgi:hypothetical protein
VVAVFIVVIIAFFVLLNVFTLVLPRQLLQKRQDSKNAERQAFAAGQGWHFRPYAPELLQVYNCKPFTERGDRRVAFGVVVGMVDGVQVTAFDYQRRTKRTSYSGIVYSDTNQVVTVWVVKLPANLPPLHMATRGFRLLTGNFVEPRTSDVEFNKGFLIEGGDENFAMQQLFTPQVTAMMKHTRLADWTIQGNELIHYSTNHFTRTTAEEIMRTAQALVALVRSFPEQLWRGATLPPAGQLPAPMPMTGPQPMLITGPQPLPMTGPPPMPVTGPPVGQPMPYAPQPRPYPQMPPVQPPPGHYPPQPGYGPGAGWPHPQYGPPHQ